ncbi:helix-turn-helix domain-containing protein [Nocardia seriolae]|uniref:helix-turn-helix domain-containing protein n=1 Tax=Nocardia seriolae TaxID=37332 RepID=UPI0012BC4AA7|nr:helix-turn-helix transcriptional regulator [Nocardia seriolae]MTJ64913.1 helix-turn-helix domain-containing protein [Nocardia seriolae]MTJ70939.1 helix-turn-helix domain-containing protein [Nocardia seriolae]MTJ89730.1 helix-turn-helix domain-containing protein [Nocardia seriolae]MTK33705.1 helix-turn-helix domain-containing protein [Nocardia seriolae]MTK42858.1 helix-turn-helix domain-containing protein [Nocardia seriolae]
MTSDDEPSTLPRRQLGRFLREARDNRGLAMDKAAQLAELSKTGLHRIETGGVKKLRLRDMRALCEIYEVTPADTDRAVELAKQAQTASWYTAFAGLYGDATFNMYVGLAASASRLSAYHEIMLGLVQTADYARALISGYYDVSSHDEIERRVELRLERQTIITRKAAPVKLELLLHESALHRVFGGHRVMAAQLRHLAEIGKLPNVSLRVQPFSSGCSRGLLHGPFVILEFGDDAKGRPIEPPLVYLEGAGRPDFYMENADDVRRYHEIASAIRNTALTETRTRDLIRQVARSYAA